MRFSSTEEVGRRVPAREMFQFISTMKSNSSAPPPLKRVVNPGLMFMRAIGNALRHGVRVKRR